MNSTSRNIAALSLVLALAGCGQSDGASTPTADQVQATTTATATATATPQPGSPGNTSRSADSEGSDTNIYLSGVVELTLVPDERGVVNVLNLHNPEAIPVVDGDTTSLSTVSQVVIADPTAATGTTQGDRVVVAANPDAIAAPATTGEPVRAPLLNEAEVVAMNNNHRP